MCESYSTFNWFIDALLRHVPTECSPVHQSVAPSDSDVIKHFDLYSSPSCLSFHLAADSFYAIHAPTKMVLRIYHTCEHTPVGQAHPPLGVVFQ